MTFLRMIIWLGALFFVFQANAVLQKQTAQEVAANDSEVQAIQSALEQLEKEKKKKEQRRARLFLDLQKQEEAIARIAKKINQLSIQIQTNRSETEQLRLEAKNLQSAIKEQQAALSAQIKSAYASGDNDLTKMLFNQDQAGDVERMLTYYQYFYQQRKINIDKFKALFTELKQVETALSQKQTELTQIVSKQESEQIDLQTQQASRQLALQAIERDIKGDESKIAQLKADEQRLVDAINAAQEAASSQKLELNGLRKQKGQLLAPASGKLRRLFATRRQGQLKWKGIIINGEAGAPIQSIHTGKVLYSGWLRGFGLVLVVDHGLGFMSVYGHNQALLKEPGDYVRRGETIALMGQSGGQTRPNLYFELRNKGVPVNPTAWLDF